MTDLERCLAFLRALDERCAERRERVGYGTAYFHDSLPRVWDLNFLAVDRGADVDARRLAAEADRLQEAAGLKHRKVAIDDDAHGSRLARDFRRLGWSADPVLVMVFRGPAPSVDHERVLEIDFETLAPVYVETLDAADWGSDEDEAARQVVGQRRVIGAAGAARYFAAFADSRPVSYCELYTDGDVGQIEGVLTKPDYRGRGLAKAVVTRARIESATAGHTLTFLLADEDEWPKELYRRLGFVEVGRVWSFLRRPTSGLEQ